MTHLVSIGLPGKGHHGILHVQQVARNKFLAQMKQFKVCVLALLALGVSQDVDAHVVTMFLPVNLALSTCRERAFTHLTCLLP